MFPYLRFELKLRPAGALRKAAGQRRRALAGPRLRRVLGKCLIDRFCPFGKPICESRVSDEAASSPTELCDLAPTCPYGVAFAESCGRRPPFALYVPGEGGAKAPDRVELTLYGAGWRLYPWMLQGLREALRGGLGKGRLQWEIEEVWRLRADGEELLDSGSESLPARLSPELLGLSLEPFLAPQQLEVRLCSPTRLIDQGRLVRRAAVGLELLVARILDRFGGLYGDDSSEILRPEIRGPIEAQAARVPLLVDETTWVEAPDYSARSRSKLSLGGKVGRLVYGEAAAPFYGILRAGEILHVGKNPASGRGRIKVDLLAAPR